MMTMKLKKVEEMVDMLKGLLEKKVVDGIVIPQVIDGKFVQNLIAKPDQITDIAPFAPVFNVNTGSLMTRWVGTKKKIGVVLKPCELRAVIELIKLKQIDPDKVLLIGTDCFGSFTLSCFNENESKIGAAPDHEHMAKIGKKLGVRNACLLCSHHLPTEADIVLGRIGKGFFIGGRSEKGLEALKELDMKEDALKKWTEAGEHLDKTGKTHREKEFKKIADKLKDPKALEEFFADCIGCKNCRLVCPVCYCKECFFDKPLANPSADEMVMLANAKNGLRMPLDILFFHLVRLNHMSISCIGCGMCDDACPKDIPVSLVFQCIGDEVQKAFEYEAGRSISEAIPLSKFEENDPEPYTE